MAESPHRSPNKPISLTPSAGNTPTFAPGSFESHRRSSPSPISSHRQSFSEQLRGLPASPHSRRQPSLSQQAFQELLNNPPLPHKTDNIFEGRDWKSIQVGEVTDPKQIRFVELDTSVEEATNILITSGSPNVVFIRHDKSSRVAVSTFDYSDLNAYLLVVVGLAAPEENQLQLFNDLAKKAREGKHIALREIGGIGRRDPFITLPHTANLTHAVGIFGSGIHRIIITKEGTQETVGVLTQLKLVKFFWENGRNFQQNEGLFYRTLKDLSVGSHTVKAINGDKPLTDALMLMNDESITSLPVIDNQKNVVGNISHVDVRLLTKSTSLPLLRSSCIHFISVILADRGWSDGQDSVPVFYVNPYSTLAHTVAKLVATRSHRMWIVEAPSPASSAPQTPSAVTVPPPSLGMSYPMNGPPYTTTSGPAVSASALPGQHMSGRLSGVISLTDVLNLFAKASGLPVQEPDEARRRRRRSSSSSVRMSLDSVRSSSMSSSSLSRSGSVNASSKR